MRPWEARTVHLANLLVGGTGIVYAAMRYLVRPSDPYAVVNHPWQPHVQHLHVLLAPLLVFAVGLVWKAHVWKHYRQGVPARRRSGLLLLGAVAPMVVSGYLIQTTVTESWRSAWIAIHLVTSGAFVVAYAGHFLAGLGRRRRAPAR